MLRARLCQQLIIALCVRDTDSWLTVGVTDGKQNTISSVGIDFSQWTETQGIDVVQGSVFWLDVNSGPTTDRDVVIAQLTVPKGASFVGTVNAQGQTKAGSKMKVWDKRAISFQGGPETGTNAAKKCKADSECPTCSSTLDAKCVKKKGKEKDKDAQGECKCLARHSKPNVKKPVKPKDKKTKVPPPPTPSPKTDSGGSTGIVIFILLLAIVGGKPTPSALRKSDLLSKNVGGGKHALTDIYVCCILCYRCRFCIQQRATSTGSGWRA